MFGPRDINCPKSQRERCAERSSEEFGRALEKETALLKEHLQIDLVKTGKGRTNWGTIEARHARLEGCVRVGLKTHLRQGDPWSERGAGRGWGAVRQRLGDGDGGRKAVLLGKTNKRVPAGGWATGTGVPKPTSSSGKPRGGRRAG